jgi:tetratricopeptide (TPR) repeat protein
MNRQLNSTVSRTDPSIPQYNQSMEVERLEKKFTLLGQALKIDPAHIGVLLGVLVYLQPSVADEIELLRKIVALARRNLGEKLFKKAQGHFWGVHETRSYMCARAQLAEVLTDVGRYEEAIEELEGMIELNPNDNQGIRYPLLSLNLALGRLDPARKLLKQYDESTCSTVFAWGSLLELVLSNKYSEAEKLLPDVRKVNRYTEEYVSGKKKIPEELPGAYAAGSREEAIIFAADLFRAWRSHEQAVGWLAVYLKPIKNNRKK